MAAEIDVKEDGVHRAGYDRFVSLMKWSTLICAIIALFVIIIIQ